jgi:hypothetical protein
MTNMRGRPYLLDNQSDESRHGAALAYFLTDVDSSHALSIATGYIDLGGLHHLASLADGRPTRLLIGAAPDPGLGAALPLATFDMHRERLRDERDFSRFPPSRAAKKLIEVETWLARPEVQVRRYVEQFLHGKAYLVGDVDDGRLALVTSAKLRPACRKAGYRLVRWSVGASGRLHR